MLNKNLSYYQVSKHVLNKFGITTAMVHAIIWNSSKMEGTRCRFGEAAIGNELGIGFQKVLACIKELEGQGYIKRVYDVNEYHTKAYVYVPEKIAENISEEEYQARTLKYNNDRIAKHVAGRSGVNDTQKSVNDTQKSVNDTQKSVNDLPIKKGNILKENKENKEEDFSSINIQNNPERDIIVGKIEYFIGGKCDERWKGFIDFIYLEEQNNHFWDDFVYELGSNFDSKYAHPNYLMKRWKETDFPKRGYDPNYCVSTPIERPEYTDEEYKQFAREATRENRAKRLGIS